MHQVGLVIARYDERTRSPVTTGSFKMKHPARVKIPGQAVDHPLVPYLVLVDKSYRHTATRFNQEFMLAKAIHGPWVIGGEFGACGDCKFIIGAELLSIPRQHTGVAVHHYAATVQCHIVLVMGALLSLRRAGLL